MMNFSKETRDETPFIPEYGLEPNHAEIARALDGDNYGLDRAFYWANTPQGESFWTKQYKNGLDEWGKKILLATLLRPNPNPATPATPTAYKMAQDAKTHGYIR